MSGFSPITEFLDYLKIEKRYSPLTVLAYEGDLNQFASYLEKTYGEKEIIDVPHTLIRSWIVSLVQDGNSPRTVNRKITSLRSFYKFHRKNGRVELNPMNRVIAPKTNKRLPVFVEENKMHSLLELPVTGYKELMNRFIVSLFYSTGMRLSELWGLKPEDFSYSGVKVLGKRGKERIVPLTSEVNEIFKAFQAEKKSAGLGSEFLFVHDNGKRVDKKYIYRTVKSILGEVTTLGKRSPHVLRHTFATHMLNNGADLVSIKELLGHANLSATQVYTHNSVEKLRNIHRKAHPRG